MGAPLAAPVRDEGQAALLRACTDLDTLSAALLALSTSTGKEEATREVLLQIRDVAGKALRAVGR